VGSI